MKRTRVAMDTVTELRKPTTRRALVFPAIGRLARRHIKLGSFGTARKELRALALTP